jgi:hypothetical protein
VRARSDKVMSTSIPLLLSSRLACTGTNPVPAAISSKEKCVLPVRAATAWIKSRVVETPPKRSLNDCRSRNELSISSGVPESLSSNSIVGRRFISRVYRMSKLLFVTDRSKMERITKLRPALPQAIACYRDRCSSHSWRSVPRECQAPRCGHRAEPQCGRHFAPWRRGAK